MNVHLATTQPGAQGGQARPSTPPTGLNQTPTNNPGGASPTNSGSVGHSASHPTSSSHAPALIQTSSNPARPGSPGSPVSPSSPTNAATPLIPSSTPPTNPTHTTNPTNPQLVSSPAITSSPASSTGAVQVTPPAQPASSTTSTLPLNASSNSAGLKPVNHHRHAHRPFALQQLRSAFSPSTHDIVEKVGNANDTVRPYLHRRQRWRLWRLSIGEFLITVLLCLSYFLILFLYSKIDAMDKSERHIFNSLTTGNALFLGVNIANSLRSYAKMLRWRILASRYRSLAEFDLIMGCDSIWNVLELFWFSKWTSLTKYLTALWIIVQLGCAVAVGIIGLTYNLDISTTQVLLQTGNTSVLNLPSLLDVNYDLDLSSIQTWGIRGDILNGCQGTTYMDLTSSDCTDIGSTYLYDSNSTFALGRYFFNDVNVNPDPGTQVYEGGVSYRYIDSYVACTPYKVVDGIYGNLTYFAVDVNGTRVYQNLVDPPGPNGIYVTSSLNSTCGDRCTNVTVFQAQADWILLDDGSEYQDEAIWFQCNSTISQVQDLYYSPVEAEYQIDPLISRMLAGMYGWSSNPVDGNTEYETITSDNEQAYTNTASNNATEVALSIARFTIGGIAQMDISREPTLRKNVADGRAPIQAQILDVKWWAAGTLLGIIPFIHFWTMFCVIIWANKAIIKDDMPLAIAKSYQSLFDKLGRHGCIMTGTELADHMKTNLGVEAVVWGYSESDIGSDVRHADVFERSSNVPIERTFHQGNYDGDGPGRGQSSDSGLEDEQSSLLRSQNRSVDARMLF